MRQMFGIIIAIFCLMSVAHAAETQQLSASDMKTATQLNQAYARHMYSSNCVERQRQMTSPILTPDEKSKLMSGFQKSCDCLADRILKDVQSNDVIGYVTYMNGSIEPGQKRVKADPQTKEKNAKIMTLGHDKTIRSSCGFKQ